MANKVIGTALETLTAVKEWANGKFVVQETGKGLSTNDFTDALKTKLNSVESDAEKNIIETIKVNGTALTPDDNRAVDITVAAAPIQEIDVNGSKVTPVEGVVDIEVPTKLSDLTDDLGSSPVHTHSQYAETSDLDDYYTKSETYTKTEVDSAISTARTGGFKVVSTLPTAGADCVGYIYLIPKTDSKEKNVKEEYICIKTSAEGVTPATYAWEKIGDTEVDLSEYAKTSEVNTALNGKVDKVTGKGLSTNDYDATEKGHVADAVTHMANNDIHVKASDKTAWSAKYDKPGNGIPYTDLATGVQGSLDKADSAVQTAQGTSNVGKILKVNASGDLALADMPNIPEGTVKSVKITTTAPLAGGSDTAQTETGSWSLSLADNYGDTKAPFASKTAGTVLAAPTASNGVPSFRALVVADISDLEFMTKAEMLEILNS